MLFAPLTGLLRSGSADRALTTPLVRSALESVALGELTKQDPTWRGALAREIAVRRRWRDGGSTISRHVLSNPTFDPATDLTPVGEDRFAASYASGVVRVFGPASDWSVPPLQCACRHQGRATTVQWVAIDAGSGPGVSAAAPNETAAAAGVLVSGGEDGFLAVHDPSTGALLRKWSVNLYGVGWLQADPKVVWCRGLEGYGEGGMTKWDLLTGEQSPLELPQVVADAATAAATTAACERLKAGTAAEKALPETAGSLDRPAERWDDGGNSFSTSSSRLNRDLGYDLPRSVTAVHMGGARLACGHDNGSVSVHRDRQQLFVLDPGRAACPVTQVLCQRTRIIAGGAQGFVVYSFDDAPGQLPGLQS